MQGFGLSLLQGLGLTIQLSMASVTLGFFLALLLALAQLSRFWVFRGLASAYIALLRSVPELLVILLLYYGGSALISMAAGEYVEVNPFLAGAISLSAIFAAYGAETLRGAFLAVPKGQIEAAQACGLSSLQILRKVHLPLAWRHAIPGLGNLWLVMLKESALVSVIGLEELTRKSKIAAGFTKEPFTFYLAAALLYLLVTLLSALLLRWLENRSQLGFKAAHL